MQFIFHQSVLYMTVRTEGYGYLRKQALNFISVPGISLRNEKGEFFYYPQCAASKNSR